MRNLRIGSALALILLGLAQQARADQCAWITANQANKALQYLRPGTEYASYCEPCGETTPNFAKVTNAEVGTPEGGAEYSEVRINGEGVDIAYIFVRKDQSQQYFNLAKLAGCTCTGVSKTITQRPVSLKTKLSPWYGRYQLRGQLTEIALKETTLHTGWIETTIFLISDQWGDQRGELTGYLHADEDQPRFVTPFHDCDLFFTLNGANLVVRDNGKCDALMHSVTGTYQKGSAF